MYIFNYLTKHTSSECIIDWPHTLFVEVEHNHGLERFDRKCVLCTLKKNEVEFNFVVQCKCYRD